ncbi:MAG: hypothetical protein ABI779_01975 [Acidobacteriota bacterium]
MRIFVTVIAACAALYALALTWRQNERAAGLDFYIYFVAGQLAGRADVDDIYGADVQERVGEEYFERARQSGSELRQYDAQRRRRLDLVSSPFLFTTLRWVSGNYERALLQDHVLVLGAFMAGLLLLCRASGVSWAASLFLLAALLLWYRGFEADLRVGNVNSLQLAALGAFVWLIGRRSAVGSLQDHVEKSQPTDARPHLGEALPWILLGALVLFKPNLMFVPLLFAVARVARREFRRLGLELTAGAAGALAAFVIASISYGSPRVWLQWVRAANAFYHRLPGRMERNVTPALGLFQQYGEWISYALAALLLVIVCVVLVRTRSDDAPLLAGLGVLIYLMTANVVWLHYMVLLIPVAAALMRWRFTGAVALLALLLAAEEPFEWAFGRAALPVETMLITPALLLLFVCAVWKLSDRHPAAALM